MKHGRLDAEGAQGTDAPDTEDHLLANARRFVATVESVGDVAIGRRVLGTVGVEKVDGDTAYLRLPDPGIDIAAGDAHYYLRPFPIWPTGRLNGEIAWQALAVFRVLDAVVVDGLGEIPLPI